MTTENKPIQILIADDHAIVRQGIALLIEESLENANIIQTSSVNESIAQLRKLNFDLAILDVEFQDGICLEIIESIKNLKDKPAVLIFSSHNEKTHALKYINAGANGFLNKLSTEDQIKSALLEVLNTGKYISSSVQDLLLERINNPEAKHPIHKLSEREQEIAQLLAEGLGNLEISNLLDIKQNTVSTLKKRIFDKLEVNNIVDLIHILNEK